MMKKLPFLFVLLFLLTSPGCTKANPNACCVNADDCKQVGLSSVKGCDQGLTCVDNQCIQQTCSTQSCMADQPVCNVVTNVCDGCTESSQCASYPGQLVCDTTSGACVGCVVASDCPTDKPVCDANVCRACALDSDCASGACASDGRCLDEADLVYVDNAAGSNVGTCTKAAPCKTVSFALSKTTAARSNVVVAPGTYQEGTITVSSAMISAPSLEIHGGGSTWSTTSGNEGDILYVLDVATTIHDVTFLGNGTAGADIQVDSAPAIIYRDKFMGNSGGDTLLVNGNTIAHDIEIASGGIGIAVGGSGHLTLDRAVIHDGYKGIIATLTGARVDISNTLIYSMTDLAMDLSGATGSVSFSTVGDSGSFNGTDPISIKCPSSATGLAITSSIVWAPQASMYSSIGGVCALNTVIAGPHAVAGAMNVDPTFVDEAHRNYHLAVGSPARDVVDAGPQYDFEGDPRPQGPRFDIGADEAR